MPGILGGASLSSDVRHDTRMILLFLIFLIFPVVWIVSDFRAKPLVRIGLGLVAMTVAGVVSAQLALIKPESENKYLHDSLQRIHALLREGRADKVEKGFGAYNDEIKL